MNHEDGEAVRSFAFSGEENRHYDVAVFQLFDHGLETLAVREQDLIAFQRVFHKGLMFALFVCHDAGDFTVANVNRTENSFFILVTTFLSDVHIQ